MKNTANGEGVTTSAFAGGLAAQTSVSAADLEAAVSTASTAYVSARQNIAQAAATVFYIHFYACSDQAAPDHRAWFEAKHEKRRREIEAWNAELDGRKEAEKASRKAELTKLTEERRKANDRDRQEALDADIKALKNASDARLRDLNAQQKVKLETRSDAEPFSEITKLILELHSSKQSSQVHRVAKVVRWVASKWNAKSLPDVASVTKIILDEGGFDAVYDIQHGVDGKKKGNATAGTVNAQQQPASNEDEQAVAEHFRAVVAAADPLGVFSPLDAHAEGSLVALIGRVGPDGIAIISDVGMQADELLALCVSKQERRLLPGDPASEFVAVALTLGELVEEGKRTIKDRGSVEITRQLSMLVDEDCKHLVISAINTPSCVIVRAEPKHDASVLLPSTGYRWLRGGDVKQLTERLANGVSRKMITLHPDTEQREVGEDLLPSELAWTSTSGPLATKGDASATLVHPWLAMSPAAAAPLDVDGFKEVGTVTLSREGLLVLSKGKVGNWRGEKADSKASNKAAARSEIHFNRSNVTTKGTQGEDSITGDGSIRGQVTLSFRPRMLAQVLDVLVQLNVSSLDMSPDDRGVLRIAFEDRHGRYSVFLPACKADGELETARFHPIRVSDLGEV